MRNTYQLLQVLRKNVIESENFHGMCEIVHSLNMGDETHDKNGVELDYINDTEFNTLLQYIEDNRPEWIALDEGSYIFWWDQGLKEPRIKWINNQLLKLKEIENGKTKEE